MSAGTEPRLVPVSAPDTYLAAIRQLGSSTGTRELLERLERLVAGVHDVYRVYSAHLERDLAANIPAISLESAVSVDGTSLRQWLDDRPDQVAAMAAGLPVRAHDLILVPLTCGRQLEALLCVEPSSQELAATDQEHILRLCQDSAPIFARLREIEEWRSGKRASEQAPVPNSHGPAPGAAGNAGSVGNAALSQAVHELRGLLVAARGYTKLVFEQQAGPINDTQREYLSILSQNVSRMTRVVNGLSNTSAVEPLKMKPIDLSALCGELLSVLGPQAARRQVSITQQIPSKPLVVAGDRDKLSLVFFRLLSNAIKLASSEGEVFLELSEGNNEVVARIWEKGKDRSTDWPEQVIDGGRRESGDGAASRNMLEDILRQHGGGLAAGGAAGVSGVVTVTLSARGQ